MARQKLLKLVKHINMLNLNPTVDSPEYRFLDPLITDDMADVMLSMKLRKLYTIGEVAKKLRKPHEELRKLVAEMEQIGCIETHVHDGQFQFKTNVFAPGIFEIMSMKLEDMEKYPHMGQNFDEYIMNFGKLFHLFPQGTGLMKVLPVQKAIENDIRTADYEEVDFWLKKYEGHISVGNCQCRTLRRQNGTAGGNLEGEWCISLGDFSDQLVKTGKNRKITEEEARTIIKKAEERGYVHQVSNIDGPRESVFICNCAAEVCLAIKTSTLFATPNFSKSNFEASVEEDKCVACGGCVEVCPVNAVKLGHKMCEKELVKIPEPISNLDHKWGKDQWQMDFYTNRKNVIEETGTSPCKTECPAHIAVQGYVKLASKGRYKEALELIKVENPFPAVCGRICPHNCEGACTRGDLDAPVAIDDIKKFIAEQELNSEHQYIPEKRFDHGKKIAVVGSGPAGLSCAYYLAVYGHEVTVFEKESRLGGMLTLGIPSYRLDKDVVGAEIDVLKKLGVRFELNCEIGEDRTLDDLRHEGYKAFYLAIGAQGGRSLNIEGEDHEDVMAGVTYLKDVNLGKDIRTEGKVVVIGGGNVAIDVARTATRTGAEACSMYCLEGDEEMPAQDEEIHEAKAEGIAINNGWGPVRIVVEEGRLRGIEFRKCLRVKDSEGRFAPEFDDDDQIFVEADKILLSIGQSIEWKQLLEESKVVLRRNQTAEADGFTYQTDHGDIFVGGDAYTGPGFAIDAIAAGKQGAESLHRFVWEGHDLLLNRDRRVYKALDKDNIVISGYDNTPRQRPMQIVENENTFKDPRGILTAEQVAMETSRCLKCGSAYVDATKCIGCGVCTVQCRFDAISLSREHDGVGVTYEKLPVAIGKYAIKRQGKVTAKSIKDKLTKG